MLRDYEKEGIKEKLAETFPAENIRGYEAGDYLKFTRKELIKAEIDGLNALASEFDVNLIIRRSGTGLSITFI